MPDPVLLYEFTPATVSVSVGGENPVESFVDLEIKIDNRGPATMVQLVQILIPIGAQGDTAGNRLSAIARLPDPEYDKDALSAWKIEVDEDNGSLLRIKAKSSKPTMLEKTMELVFHGILINDTPGIVPVTVDEFAPNHIKATFQIDKEDAERPVQRFYVADEHGNELNPPSLNDFDQRVWLKWLCTEQGEKYSYGIRTEKGEAWVPKDWRRTGEYFNCADGKNGIQTNKLAETTTFALEVIQKRSAHQILYTTVQLEVPTISDLSHQKTAFSNRLARLYWKASNAANCTLISGEDILADNAPVDTYETGYLVVLDGFTGAFHQLSIVAHANSGPAKATRGFPLVTVSPVSCIAVGNNPSCVAVTRDGNLALVATGSDLTLVDILTQSVVRDRIPIGHRARAITIDRSGNLAVVSNSDTAENVTIVDIHQRATWIQSASPNRVSCITADGRTVLVISNAANQDLMQAVQLGSLHGRSDQGALLGIDSLAVAVTPDGALALVVDRNSREVAFVDVASHRVSGRISVGGDPVDIAISDDGSLAMVANNADLSVSLIKIRGRSVNAFPVQYPPSSVAFSSDGKLGFVASSFTDEVKVIDIAAGRALPGLFNGGGRGILDLVVTPNREQILALTTDGNLIII